MNLPTSQPILPDDGNLPPARRRRNRRTILPHAEGERAEFLKELSLKLSPTFDFFLFSALTAIAIGAAILLDVPALYLLAALLAPFMAPAIGLGLATIVGSLRFFLQSLSSLLLGATMVFVGGVLAGWLSTMWDGLTLQQAAFHTVISWPDVLLLSLGVVLTAFLTVRSRTQRPLVTSVAVAYELYLPAGVAGFGILSGQPGLFPDGLIVFLVHLAWTILLGTIVLGLLGLRPRTFLGYGMTTSVVLVLIAGFILLSGIGTALTAQVALPTSLPTRTLQPSLTPTITETPLPPTITPTITETPIPTATPTFTATVAPTEALALISSPQYGGAAIRIEPGYDGQVITYINNGYQVFVTGEEADIGGITWSRVRLADGRTGWIQQDLLRLATPQP